MLQSVYHPASQRLAAATAQDPPICTVARLSKDSRGIGQMEHSVTPVPAGARRHFPVAKRSGGLRADMQVVAELEGGGRVQPAALETRPDVAVPAPTCPASTA
jgi:hypothetical protein